MTAPLDDGARAAAVERACAAVDPERVADICAALVDVPSPTGEEEAAARWLVGEMADRGLDGHLQPLDDLQANAWGTVPGGGSVGPTLMLYAPLDTLVAGEADEDVPAAGPVVEDHMRPRARREGGRVVGLGAHNPKGHAACVLAAAEAVAATGVPLAGRLVAAFGAGGMPGDARDVPGPGPGGSGGHGRHGRRNTGQGVGASFLLEQGVWADAAVIAKSGWAVAWEEVGLAWIDLTVRGTHVYVGARHRLPYRNAVDDAARVVRHLEGWFPAYAEAHTSGLVAPQGIVAAVRAGWWRMAAATPAAATVRVDLRLAPGTSPLDGLREVDAALDELRQGPDAVDVEATLALGIPGSRTDPGHWVCRRATAAWELVTGRPHQPLTGTSGATDANILRNRGVPTARVGLPKAVDDGAEVGFQAGMNTVDVDALGDLTRLLVACAVDVCTRDRRSLAAGTAP